MTIGIRSTKKAQRKKEDDEWAASRGHDAHHASQPTSAGGGFKGSNTYKQR